MSRSGLACGKQQRRRLRSLSLGCFLAANCLVHPVLSLLPPFFTTQLWSSVLEKIATRNERTFQGAKTVRDSANDYITTSKGGSTTRILNYPGGKVPFAVVEVDRNRHHEFQDVSDMCIDVFFNEGTKYGVNGRASAASLWKSVNLAYLRHAQYSDLRTRKLMTSAKSTMFVARKIVPSMEEKDSLRRPEWNDVENSQLLRSGMRGTNGQRANGYKLGDVIGFVEVSARPFGLGQGSDLSDTGRPKIRPVLANLAVKKEVRGSGVGSKLVEACEEKVISWSPTFNEIVLQVEEDNPNAKRFYENRGYQVVFSDPTCRRFDASGVWVKKVRATKVCMRKDLAMKRLLRIPSNDREIRENGLFRLNWWQNFRDRL